MAQLNVKLSDEQLGALRRYVRRRRTTISWLVRDYVDHLLGGGAPVAPPSVRNDTDLARIAERGGSFDFLAEEPDIYTLEDGEPL